MLIDITLILFLSGDSLSLLYSTCLDSNLEVKIFLLKLIIQYIYTPKVIRQFTFSQRYYILTVHFGTFFGGVFCSLFSDTGAGLVHVTLAWPCCDWPGLVRPTASVSARRQIEFIHRILFISFCLSLTIDTLSGSLVAFSWLQRPCQCRGADSYVVFWQC